MEDPSDGEDVAAPQPSAADTVKNHSGAAPPGLDANAPVFVPGRQEVKEGKASRVGEETCGPSLVFGGGGDFLSKYRSLQRNQEVAQPRLRKNVTAPVQQDAAAVGTAANGVSAPERLNLQLNSMLVHARSFEKILQVVEQHFDDFNGVNLITALHRLALQCNESRGSAARKSALRRDVRFKRLISRLSDTLRNSEAGDLKPQDLSNIAWALTKIGLLNGALFGHLMVHIMNTIHNFEPVNLSMTLWAFARSGFLDEKLFRVAATEVKRQLPEFEPQQIANTTWAMAKSGFVDEEVFLSAADLALQKLPSFQPMNSSMLLYSFALAKLPHPKLFEEVGKRCSVEALTQANSAPHVVTNLAIAFSDAGIANQAVFNNIAKVASTSLHDFRTQQIASLTQAFAKAELRNERLFASISAAVVERLDEFKQQDLQDLLKAYQSLGVSTVEIARAIDAQQQVQEVDSDKNFWLVIALILTLLLGCVLFLQWRSTKM